MRSLFLLFLLLGLSFLGTFPAFAGGNLEQDYSCKPSYIDTPQGRACTLPCLTEDDCEKEAAALEALRDAKEVTFYVMDGSPGAATPKGEQPVLGGYIPVEQKELKGDLARDVVGEFLNSIVPTRLHIMCFSPHHALSIQTEDHLYEYVLCYQCTMLLIYQDGKQISFMNTKENPSQMNRLVEKAGMSLPEYYRRQIQ